MSGATDAREGIFSADSITAENLMAFIIISFGVHTILQAHKMPALIWPFGSFD
jgi:hypothetical protein